MKIICTALFLVFTAISIHAQSLPSPVIFKSELISQRDSGSMVTLVNTSSKKIIAYVLKIEELDAEGKVIHKISDVRVFGLETLPISGGKVAGEQWNHKSGLLANPGLPASRLTMDYILFEDNLTWGPNTLGLAAKISGIQEGWKVANVVHQQILQEQGTAGLVDYLSRIKERE